LGAVHALAIAPFCLGLLAGLLVILVQFFRELAHLIAELPQTDRSNVIWRFSSWSI
jgi:uncharacterized membrane protein YqhA